MSLSIKTNEVRLTDRSIAYDVVLIQGDSEIVIGTIDRKHARLLVRDLEKSFEEHTCESCIEVDGILAS